MTQRQPQLNLERLPIDLKAKLSALYTTHKNPEDYLRPNEIYHGDALQLLPQIEPNSIALSV